MGGTRDKLPRSLSSRRLRARDDSAGNRKELGNESKASAGRVVA